MIVNKSRKWHVADYATEDNSCTTMRIWGMRDRKDAICAYAIPDAVIIGSPGILGTMRDETLNWFIESTDHRLFDIQYESIITTISGKDLPCVVLDGEWIFLAGPLARNFYHWMIETLTKVCIAEIAGYHGNYLVPKSKFVDESMELMGVHRSRIRVAGDYSWYHYYYQVKKLVVFDRMNGATDVPRAQMLLQSIRARMLGEKARTSVATRKLYIAREHSRTVRNEDELLVVLEKHGFERIVTEKMSLQDQITMISEAKILMGPHGAGLIHSMFMHEKTTTIELASPNYMNTSLMAIVGALGNRYYTISSISREETNDITAPLIVIDALLTALEEEEEEEEE